MGVKKQIFLPPVMHSSYPESCPVLHYFCLGFPQSCIITVFDSPSPELFLSWIPPTPVSSMSWIPPVLHTSCPACLLSCIPPVLHTSCPTFLMSCICPVRHTSCPASILSCIPHNLYPSDLHPSFMHPLCSAA